MDLRPFQLGNLYNTGGPEVLEHPKLIRSITVDRCSNFTSAGSNGNDLNLLSQLYKARTNSGKIGFLPLSFIHNILCL
jgi:alpha-mannosidase